MNCLGGAWWLRRQFHQRLLVNHRAVIHPPPCCRSTDTRDTPRRSTPIEKSVASLSALPCILRWNARAARCIEHPDNHSATDPALGQARINEKTLVRLALMSERDNLKKRKKLIKRYGVFNDLVEIPHGLPSVSVRIFTTSVSVLVTQVSQRLSSLCRLGAKYTHFF
jgi:hypothetical protein